MSVVGNKVRVYDLARELKQDTKRIIEDLRREGADIDVPSNSVNKELADKIRNKYFPKVEAAPKRTIKVIKRKPSSDSPALEDHHEPLHTAPEIETPPVEEPRYTAPTLVEETPRADQNKIKILTKKVVAQPEEEPVVDEEIHEPVVEQPEPVEVVEQPEPVEVIEQPEPVEVVEQPEPVEVVEQPKPVEQPAPEPVKVKELVKKVVPVTGVQVKRLTLNKDAIQKGIKPGDRLVSNAPTKTGKLSEEHIREQEKEKDRRGRDPRRGDPRGTGRKPEFRGTPGESSTPLTVYTPPADNRRKPGRSSGKKGEKTYGDKGGRFEEKDFSIQRPRSIEERIKDQVGAVPNDQLKFIRLTEGATVREFSEALGVTPRDIVQLLVKKGVFATLNQPIGEKMAKEVGKSLGFDVNFVPFEEMVIEQEFEELIAADADDVETSRAPVVTVMGHVDHGKTSLLDAIRHANVAEGEAGGITQHIGAYSVFVNNPDNPEEKRRVVFLDTPGHEAFTMMRARGAKATDIVILVVAADDGVMPQTIEAVEHSKAAGVPIIVAINKIDKPDANPDKVKQGLSALGVQPLDWGGDVEMVPVSAKKRENLDTLLETVLLQADIMELKASPTRRASGVVLEAKLDKGRGSVATVLVQQGTLRVGDPFIVGQVHGKVRAMFGDRGETVAEAPPATPVEVLGLQGVPGAGDTFQVVADIEQAVSIANQRQMKARQAALLKTTKRGIESLGQAEVKELLVVLKADVQGSVEVLRATLEKLSTDKVKVRVIRAGVGAIAESDVLLASATQADNSQTAVVIIGFNVRPEARAAEVAKQEDVDIRLHSIIYKVEEEIKAAMIGMLDRIEKENILGKALVQEVFKVSKVGTIAGCRVTDGIVRRQAKARLIRDGVVIWEGDISSLKRFKDDVNEVRQGFECGISLVNFNDIKVDDEIEAYVIESIAATEL
ncbi:MAG: translation initiation factor IF-2 [Acidobacteria bacterium]|nr:translation initiation factor IF-2 [Acidobacteriota bacterium]